MNQEEITTTLLLLSQEQLLALINEWKKQLNAQSKKIGPSLCRPRTWLEAV